MDADTALAIRLILAIGLAWALTFTLGRRLLRLDMRGAGVVGGVCAGIALGPAIFGVALPRQYELFNVGASAQTQALHDFQEQRELDESALASAGVSAIAVDEAANRNDAIQADLLAAQEAERARFKAVPLGIASSLGLIFLMLGSWFGFSLNSRGALLGVVSGVLVSLFWAVIARRLLGLGLTESIFAGALLAGGTCWSRGAWRWSFGFGSVVLVLAACVFAGATRAGWTAGLAIALGSALSFTSKLSPTSKRRWMWGAHAAIAPPAIAIIVSLCSVNMDAGTLAFVVIAGVFGADVHALGAWVSMGWLETRRRRELPMSSWFTVYAQGWAGTSLIVTGLVFATGVLDPAAQTGGAIGLAVAAHVLSVEVTRPPMHRLLASLRKLRRDITQP